MFCQVMLSTGMRIIIGAGIQEVHPLAFDYEQTEGICENFNNISSDNDDKIIQNSNPEVFDSGSFSQATRLTEYNAFVES